METFEKKLADAIAGKNSEIDKEAGTINLDWWLDPAWGLTDIDADHLVALLTAENPDMTFASAKIRHRDSSGKLHVAGQGGEISDGSTIGIHD